MSLFPKTRGTLVSCFIASNWCFAGDSQEQHVSCQLRCPKETKVHAPRLLLTPDAYLSLDRKPEISRLMPSTRQKLNIPFHLKISLCNFVMSLDSPFYAASGSLGNVSEDTNKTDKNHHIWKVSPIQEGNIWYLTMFFFLIKERKNMFHQFQRALDNNLKKSLWLVILHFIFVF